MRIINVSLRKEFENSRVFIIKLVAQIPDWHHCIKLTLLCALLNIPATRKQTYLQTN